MRLKLVARGRFGQRLGYGLTRLVSGRRLPDFVKVRYYRSRFFGKPFFQLTHAVMRGPSEWTVGERELFGAFVSAQNRCQFCATTHDAVASTVLNPSLTSAVITDWRTAEVDERVRATLGLLEKLNRTPDEVHSLDVRAALDAGVSPAAARDAIYICALFNAINRVADGLDFELPTPGQLKFGTKLSLTVGYR